MLNFTLHAKQLEIFQSLARFRIAAAGRRGGKTYLAAVELIINALKDEDEYGNDLKLREVWYVAPTFEMGKNIMWKLLKHLAQDVTEKSLDNTCELRLINGRSIKIKGSDKPDSLRGVGISFVVLDEFAFMKSDVWEVVLLPTLLDVQGKALIIGTPDGKNHFYDLYAAAKLGNDPTIWEAFHFTSRDNPFLPQEDLESLTENMSRAAVSQEIDASFDAHGGDVLNPDDFKLVKEFPRTGSNYITMDPAGFGKVDATNVSAASKKLDRCAIALGEVHDNGDWFVKVHYGRWGVRETATRFLRACQQFKPIATGIEQGSLKNALLPYIEEEKRRFNIYPHIEPLKHNNQKKTDRIIWSLQGRAEHGRIHLVDDGPWCKEFLDECAAFPSKLVHDDGPDAVSYLDQLAVAQHFNGIDPYSDEWTPIDPDAGY